MMLLLLQLKVCAAAVNAHTLRTPNHGGLYRSGRRCDRCVSQLMTMTRLNMTNLDREILNPTSLDGRVTEYTEATC